MELLLMALAAYRLTRLVVRDTFPPVLAVRDRLAGGWRAPTEPEVEQIQRYQAAGVERPDVQEFDGVVKLYVRRSPRSPYWLAELLSCPWCASGWVSGAVTAATDLAVGVPLPWLTGFAVWAASSLLAARSWA